MEIHGLLGVHRPPVTDCLVNPPVGFPGLVILCLPDRAGKYAYPVCNHRHQVGHDQIVAAAGYVGMELGILDRTSVV